MWPRRLTRALINVLITATLLHALVATSLLMGIISYGPGKGAGPFAAIFIILTLLSLGLASTAFLARRGLANMYPGGIIPILILACLWLIFAAAPVFRMQLF